MSHDQIPNSSHGKPADRHTDPAMIGQVAKKEARKLRARQQDRSIWYGLGMFGLVGWSIAIPALLGIAIGIWMDRKWDFGFSCTLTCFFIGLVAGCMIAWYWVKQEINDTNQSMPSEPHAKTASDSQINPNPYGAVSEESRDDVSGSEPTTPPSKRGS